MKVCVVGLWHLGAVTSACLAAAGHDVTGIDVDPAVVAALQEGRPPILEPGLDDLIATGLAQQRLSFTADETAASNADVVWITYDTPIDDEDRADVEWVIERVERLFASLRDGTLLLLSSQLPVGSTRLLERRFAATASGHSVSFGYVPENLRLGDAVNTFRRPARVVAGLRSAHDRDRLSALLEPFTDRIEWMSVESAEMTKHALNAFLATSIAFVNEMAAICEQVGADAREVERGLKTDPRIGPNAYLSPGAAFAGGTLARDIAFLAALSARHHFDACLVQAVKASNEIHSRWAERRLDQLLDGVSGKTIAIWGLTYKPGTDTLRRSHAVTLAEWLADRGARVRAHDPAIKQLPPALAANITLAVDAVSATEGASALVIATPWPEYRLVDPSEVVSTMAHPLVLDAGRFVEEAFGRYAGIEYVSVGRTIA